MSFPDNGDVIASRLPSDATRRGATRGRWIFNGSNSGRRDRDETGRIMRPLSGAPLRVCVGGNPVSSRSSYKVQPAFTPRPMTEKGSAATELGSPPSRVQRQCLCANRGILGPFSTGMVLYTKTTLIHTHTHTHTHKHTQAHTRTHTGTHTHNTHTHTHTNTHRHTHEHTQVHTGTHTHTQSSDVSLVDLHSDAMLVYLQRPIRPFTKTDRDPRRIYLAEAQDPFTYSRMQCTTHPV